MDLASGFIESFLLALIPLFVAMEPIGVIPVYHAMTRGMDARQKRVVLFYSILTAAAITIAFLMVGRAVFLALGITISDFQIAGGLILLSIAIVDIVHTARGYLNVLATPGVGIVPIGTPLIAGPAALTTLREDNRLYWRERGPGHLEGHLASPRGNSRHDDQEGRRIAPLRGFPSTDLGHGKRP